MKPTTKRIFIVYRPATPGSEHCYQIERLFNCIMPLVSSGKADSRRAVMVGDHLTRQEAESLLDEYEVTVNNGGAQP